MWRTLLVVVLGLVACGGSGSLVEPRASTTRATEPVAESAETATAEESDYLVAVDLADGTTNIAVQVGNGRVVSLGEMACRSLGARGTLTDVFARLMNQPEFRVEADTSTAMPAVVVAAAEHLCPDQLAWLDDQL